MQDKKEHSTGFVKNIWNKLHDWWMSFESRHLWTARLIVYFTCLAAVVSVCFYLFQYFNLFHTNVNSARYMLSALVQSQAAIVAIVITLTLIAVQLTASAYSPRVIDIFKKNPDMWILLGCYGVSIFYGFIVLKLVVGVEGEFVSQSAIWSLGRFSISFEFCVSLAYWLGAFTFVALFPYMLNIIGLLKPQKIIKRLAAEITKDKILNLKEDPIQPIMDIIHGSIMKYDLGTTRVGLKAVTDQVIKVIDSDKEKEISKSFCVHLARVSRLAISKEDEDSTVEVIKSLAKFGNSTAEKELKDAISQVVMSLGGVGVDAAKKGLEFATSQALNYLGKVGIAAAENKLEDVAKQAAGIIVSVEKESIEKRFVSVAWGATRPLMDIGMSAAKNKLEDATRQAAKGIMVVGIAAAKNKLEDATSEAAMDLLVIGGVAVENELELATRSVALSLVRVGITAGENRLKNATLQAALSLAT